MRFVPIKSPDAQSVLMLHRARQLLVRQRTAQVSALRAHLAEYGIIAPKGRPHVQQLVDLLDRGADGLPELARQTLLLIADMISGLSQQIRKIEIELMKWHRADAVCQRLETIPGIGFITATALAATVNDARVSVRAPILGLARAGAQAAFLRWQGAAGRDLEDGRPLPAPPPRRGGNRSSPLYKAQGDIGQSLGEPAAGAQASETSHRCARQQDCADCLGRDGTG
ncbi:hypothetical protein BB934_28105 (plasmid) [Microvirga ossetica]|uniref:Uncharacterized protein n=1 Tax=Microvirga ossetica TaxID=1882682 RepID=A0A1B2EQE9_9HYPH|nr:hypothetical protein BB934_28105 [Microvirga ossetica]